MHCGFSIVPLFLLHVKALNFCMCISSKYINIFTLSYQELRSIVDDLKQENKVSNKTKEIVSNSTRISTIFITGRKRSLGQGKCFPRCLSTGGLASQHASQVCLSAGGVGRPPDTWDTTAYVNKRAVRILLECILLLMAVNYLFLNHNTCQQVFIMLCHPFMT